MTQYHSQGFAGLLTILSVDSEDSGVYHCEAFQIAPNAEECYAWMRMNITLQVNRKYRDFNYFCHSVPLYMST